MPVDFEIGLTRDAPVDYGTYVSAISKQEFDEKKKQQAPSFIITNNETPNFKIHVANCQSKKLLARTKPIFDIGNNTFAKHFVVRKKQTGPNIGLHFKIHNSVSIDTAHGLILFPSLTKQAKNAASKISAQVHFVLAGVTLTIPPMTTKLITAFVDYPSQWTTTGTETPLEKFTEAASLLIS